MELDENLVELVMRLVLDGQIDRTVACRFVTPWVEGQLPSTPRAESGAQIIHGLDIVREDGLAVHPNTPDTGVSFAIDREEMVRRCSQWLRAADRTSRSV